jgi:hypothetical protein
MNATPVTPAVLAEPRGRRLPWWLGVVLAVLALTMVYAGALRSGFLNDDHLFIEEARTRPLLDSLGDLGSLGNYYRPLSRQIYFEALSRIGGGHPLVFHGVNFMLFAFALALLGDLLGAILHRRGVMAGILWYALLPFQRVNLVWISCSQDLMALAASLGAVALHRRGRTVWTAVAYAAAVASKEAALPLPLALVAWDRIVQGEPARRSLRRHLPLFAVAAAWCALALWMRARHAAATKLSFSLDALPAAYAHMVQSLLGLEHPAGFLASLLTHAPPALPFFLLAPLSMWYAATRPGEPFTRVPARSLVLFAAAWMALFGFMVWPVAYSWSGYYYTLAAVGGAMLVGWVLGRGDRWVWLALGGALLWWNAAGTGTRAFATAEHPWQWTSRLTSFYFERAAALADSMSAQLVRLEPRPPRGARFFFARLPSHAGFQMGNGALIRNLYRDPTLESHFYSQFSESTAADRPVRVLHWDGARMEPLYARAVDPMFQVGADLLILDKPAGAAHAFRRALEQGESPVDNLYWLGWAELWRGRREMAEAVWTRFGARDDSLRWIAHLRAARNALLLERDTLNAKRHLMRSIEFGIGRPEGHAVLGHLLVGAQPKYGMLELKTAAWLKPTDPLVRRDYVLALERARLDDAARKELAALKEMFPEWRADSALVRADRALAAGPARAVVEY